MTRSNVASVSVIGCERLSGAAHTPHFGPSVIRRAAIRFHRPHAGQGRVTCGASRADSGVVAMVASPGCRRRLVFEAGASFGALAQLGERLLCKQEVIGSIPIRSMKVAHRAGR